MRICGKENRSRLEGDGGDPNIVCGNRGALEFEVPDEFTIAFGSLLTYRCNPSISLTMSCPLMSAE
jgi:hypothetical protein